MEVTEASPGDFAIAIAIAIAIGLDKLLKTNKHTQNITNFSSQIVSVLGQLCRDYRSHQQSQKSLKYQVFTNKTIYLAI